MPVKIFALLWPHQAYGNESCERYYADVHVPLAIEAMGADSAWLSYHQNRVEEQYDLLGTFSHPADLWRVVVLRGATESELGSLTGTEQPLRASRPNTDKVASLVRRDHRNFVGDLRRFEVEEETIHGVPSMQTAFAKYLLFVRHVSNSSGTVPSGDATKGLMAELNRTLLEQALSDDYGLKMVVTNRVVGEMAVEEIDGSIVPATTYRAGTDGVGFIEMWFDNRHGGGRFFRQQAVRSKVHDDSASVAVYRMHETVGFDRRS